MSLKKLSADVRDLLRRRIANGVLGPSFLSDDGATLIMESRCYQAILDDAEFWRKTEVEPQLLGKFIGLRDGTKTVQKQYIFQNCAYTIKGKFTPEQEKLLIQDDFDSERRKFERLRNKFNLAQHTEPRTDRTGIPEDVRIAVWRRDNGRCVRCNSRERLEYDHIVPVSRGGSNTVRNIELLCEACNRSKGANIQ